jgi:hypothetical protein
LLTSFEKRFINGAFERGKCGNQYHKHQQRGMDATSRCNNKDRLCFAGLYQEGTSMKNH